jgi:hypothetical protein
MLLLLVLLLPTPLLQLDNDAKKIHMTELEVSSKPKPVMSGGSSKSTVSHLFVLDLSGGRILPLNADDPSDLNVIVTGCRHPDG